MNEALERVQLNPNPAPCPNGMEIRPSSEVSGYAERMTSEQLEQEERLREEVQGR